MDNTLSEPVDMVHIPWIYTRGFTPWKINMEPKNGGLEVLEDDLPFQLGDFRFSGALTILKWRIGFVCIKKGAKKKIERCLTPYK